MNDRARDTSSHIHTLFLSFVHIGDCNQVHTELFFCCLYFWRAGGGKGCQNHMDHSYWEEAFVGVKESTRAALPVSLFNDGIYYWWNGKLWCCPPAALMLYWFFFKIHSRAHFTFFSASISISIPISIPFVSQLFNDIE